jgi:TRAP-type C4-dicarboxylate transport system substrate-binding protein
MDVFQLPYIFQNEAHVTKVVTGPVGKEISDRLLKETGVHLLTFGAPSYRDLFNSRTAVNSMADMKGLKPHEIPQDNWRFDAEVTSRQRKEP